MHTLPATAHGHQAAHGPASITVVHLLHNDNGRQEVHPIGKATGAELQAQQDPAGMIRAWRGPAGQRGAAVRVRSTAHMVVPSPPQAPVATPLQRVQHPEFGCNARACLQARGLKWLHHEDATLHSRGRGLALWRRCCLWGCCAELCVLSPGGWYEGGMGSDNSARFGLWIVPKRSAGEGQREGQAAHLVLWIAPTRSAGGPGAA